MTKFQIANRTSALDLGTYEAATEEEALDLMAQDAGYADYANAAEVLGLTVEDARADLVVEQVEG